MLLEDAAAKILPPGYRVGLHRRIAPAPPRRGKFSPRWAFALVLIFLVLAAQFNSFLAIRSSSSPASVPLAMFGALIFTFLKFAGPPGLHQRSPKGGPPPSTSTRRSGS